jgi:hypothetical protein
VARDVEQHELIDQLLLAQVVPRLLDVDQQREQGVVGLLALGFDDPDQILGHVVRGLDRGLQVLVADRRIDGLGDRAGPAADQRVVPRRHAEHLGDHDQREREREVLDQVSPFSARRSRD